ncbi:hypothetical protein SUGI_0762060 [Cryptomeria japonica]|nr:hypothetical protein SUGI_0762060 [Cryptomeria japonica]
MDNKETVCVTGASGFIGSWVVRLLLEGGYSVHATVQDLGNEKETKHLESMEGAKERLKLFEVEVMDYDSVYAAISGCVGVFHLASPCIVDEVKDPQIQLLDPAIKGTTNVLQAAHKAGVKRVVVTSSISAITPSPNWPADVPKDENCWTDLDYCEKNGIWYPASKTLAEKAAWDFAKKTGLDVVVINPGTVMGPILPPAINASMAMFLQLLQGCTDGIWKTPLCGSNDSLEDHLVYDAESNQEEDEDYIIEDREEEAAMRNVEILKAKEALVVP